MPEIFYRHASAKDLSKIRELHARVFGPGRFARTAYRVREGTPDVSPFCRVASLGDRLVAAVGLTGVTVGGAPGAVLLGPLAADPEFAGLGHGRRLVREAVEHAAAEGIRLVVLVGDEPYYGRLGFKPVPSGQIAFPGPVDPARILAAETEAGALAAFHGLVRAARP